MIMAHRFAVFCSGIVVLVVAVLLAHLPAPAAPSFFSAPPTVHGAIGSFAAEIKGDLAETPGGLTTNLVRLLLGLWFVVLFFLAAFKLRIGYALAFLVIGGILTVQAFLH